MTRRMAERLVSSPKFPCEYLPDLAIEDVSLSRRWGQSLQTRELASGPDEQSYDDERECHVHCRHTAR